MKVTGLITEYNPFHNGHAYHIRKAREVTGADYVVAVMSGNFVQRGEPAVLGKYARAQMALLGGADLVLELPACYSCASAEYFAQGAIALLDRLGIVDNLCFGSECPDLSHLEAAARILALEPEAYRISLNAGLKEGQTFPAAREKALLPYLPPEAFRILSSPNNILGMEYIKALIRQNSAIQPFCIQRITSSYHQQTLSDSNGISSATAIRRELFQGNSSALLSHMPKASHDLLIRELKERCAVTADDFSLLLHYLLLQSDADQLSACLDVGPDLADRICNLKSSFTSFEQFVSLLKTRNLTETRIRRALLHLLLSIRTEEVQENIRQGWHSYIRILGFRRKSACLLKRIKSHGTLPMLSRLAADRKLLDPRAMHMLKMDIRRSEMYESVVTAKSGCGPYSEYAAQIVIL